MDENLAGPLMPTLRWGEAPVRTGGELSGDLVLPVGTVTLVLADIEGSTRLWEDDPKSMTAAIGHLDDAVGELIGRHGGVRPVEQGEGDSFVAAFSRASDALAAALALQQAELSPIRLRVGVHTGEVQLRDEGNYVGSAINRAARLRGTAHGGQVVMSAATHDLVLDCLPDGCTVLDLGTHRLRDLARPERIYQLCHPDLNDRFAPLRSLDAFAHNIPVQLTTFIGREAEVAELVELVREHRALTLTGSGGCGKTRLAVQVAAEVIESFSDGVWVAELASINDPAVVGTVVVDALGLRDEPFRSAVQTITHHMRHKMALLVLDNCEHVIDEAAALAETVLASCPTMSVLATSREPLTTTGEVTWRVPSMALPDEDREPAPITGVTPSEALELFVDRARRVRPAFTLDESNAATVTEICRRLDGIPLAIELAAARVRVLSLERIAATLDDAFRILAGGARTAVPRQQTLRASIEWSHNLLSEPERTVFRRLGVFVGTFDLDAAEAVAASGHIERHHVLDHLTLLVDKSLVLADHDAEGGEVRFRLLETVRQYATDRLETSGERDATRVRHRDHYLAVVEHPRIDSTHLDRLELDFDNLRVAFAFSHDRGDRFQALRLPYALSWSATERGWQAEVHAWLEHALADSGGVDASTFGRALATAAWNRYMSFAPGGVELAERAVDLLRDTDDDAGLCLALSALGLARFAARMPYREILDEALTLSHRSDDPQWPVYALAGTFADDPRVALHWAQELEAIAQRLGWGGFAFRNSLLQQASAMMCIGPLPRARMLLERLLREATAADDFFHVTAGEWSTAIVAALQGDTDVARDFAQRSIERASDAGFVALSAPAFTALGVAAAVSGEMDGVLEIMTEGWPYVMFIPGGAEAHLAVWIEVALATGDTATARTLMEQGEGLGANAAAFRCLLESASARVALADGDAHLAEDLAHHILAFCREQQAWTNAPHALDLLGQVAATQESYEEATRLMGAATALHAQLGSVRYATRLADHERTIALVRAELGEEQFALTWEQGKALDADAAAAYAARGRGARKRPSSGWDSLTPTELEVVALVAEGHPNKEIANQLFISPRTVQSHLTHVYAKLGLTSRVQLAQAASQATVPGAPPGSGRAGGS